MQDHQADEQVIGCPATPVKLDRRCVNRARGWQSAHIHSHKTTLCLIIQRTQPILCTDNVMKFCRQAGKKQDQTSAMEAPISRGIYFPQKGLPPHKAVDNSRISVDKPPFLGKTTHLYPNSTKRNTPIYGGCN